MEIENKISEEEYEDTMYNIKSIASNAYDIEFDTLEKLDTILYKLQKKWQGKASDEYISRLRATRNKISRIMETMYKVAEDMAIDLDAQYMKQK